MKVGSKLRCDLPDGNEDDIEQRPQDHYLWQIEERPNSWENLEWRSGEISEITAGPGATLRTYIGVHDQATDQGVRRRLVQGRLGTLVVIFTIDGQVVERRISLGPIRT